ncbi:uncharacterized protein LOC125576515 [Brassica napus]|uniref:uncharacterized protein LOC125576515 n=1 Tax=Brassica napus TaxID=3708 RepID=UPI002078B7A3|nr:uncharacterized protein LOC125576515 [Brassica napus]
MNQKMNRPDFIIGPALIGKYPTQHTAIDKFMVYKLIKTSGIGVIKRILTLSAPKRSPVSRCKKMVLRFLPQLYQEASTDCLSLFRVHCNNTNVVGVVRNISCGDYHC